MVDGEWWRVNAPRRADEDGAGDVVGDGTGAVGGPGESVYLPPAVKPAVPRPPLVKPFVPKPAAPGAGAGADSGPGPGWTAQIDMSVFDDRPEVPAYEPEPEGGAEPEPVAEVAPAAAPKRWGRKRPAAAVADAPARRGAMAGRRPSPLLLVASVVLVGGAVTGMALVMLVGWALAYLSRRLGDLTKKFAVLGIPLVTMTGVTLWFWGRSQGKWGVALQPGQQVGQQIWGSAPGVLRLAAVLSALFLLVVTMRRRRGE